MEGKNSIKKRTLFFIILLAFVVSIMIQLAENGDFDKFKEVTALSPESKVVTYDNTDSYPDGKININTASPKALDTLYGIGEKYANRIIKYREESGRFEVIQDIMKVPGIGEKRFLNIKDKISVE